MNAEFTALTEKIEQLIENCNKLRANNLGLRQKIANMRSENDNLNHRVNIAISKLEKLMDSTDTGSQ
tara:strand:- start:788 stop:988 length:201 start_codon:yes stop_codon:yes gene_type:complete